MRQTLSKACCIGFHNWFGSGDAAALTVSIAQNGRIRVVKMVHFKPWSIPSVLGTSGDVQGASATR
jgi:hypothetical protein